MPKYPFEVPFAAILSEAEAYVDAVFSCLESEFLVMPEEVTGKRRRPSDRGRRCHHDLIRRRRGRRRGPRD